MKHPHAYMTTRRKGVSMTEYGIMAALIAIAGIAAVTQLGGNTSNTLCYTGKRVGQAINSSDTGSTCGNANSAGNNTSNSTGNSTGNSASNAATNAATNSQHNDSNLVWYGNTASMITTWTVSTTPFTQSNTYTLQNASSTPVDDIDIQLLNQGTSDPITIASTSCGSSLPAWGQCTVTLQMVLTKNGTVNTIMYPEGNSGTPEVFEGEINAFVAPSTQSQSLQDTVNQYAYHNFSISSPNSDLQSVTVSGSLPPGLSFGSSLDNVSHNANSNNIALTGTPTTKGTYTFTITSTGRSGLSSTATITDVVQ